MSAVKRQLEDEKDSNKFRTVAEREAWTRFFAAILTRGMREDVAVETADSALRHFRVRCTP